ncbi:MAG TPA: prephenate dehydratase domain-containing protein [Acidimicrobiia bacterium]|jgi:prephenate dehydratase
MRIGFQGEPFSYSDQASSELFPDDDRTGYPSFVAAFDALRDGAVDRLVLPIENSTTGSVLPVLDRLLPGNVYVTGEHLVEVRHALLAVPGATEDGLKTVRSHPEALSQAEGFLTHHDLTPIPTHDTAGAVRQVAEHRDPTEAALAPESAAEPHGLIVLRTGVIDRSHNTTRFFVLAPGTQQIPDDADKTTVSFVTSHHPGALALALTEFGLRGANLTRIESRPSEAAWNYRFYVDFRHQPGPGGLKSVLDPPMATLADLRVLGTYVAAEH